MNDSYKQLIAATDADRRGLFASVARRLGIAEGNVEKDFWVCWTLEALFHGRTAEAPRLLFKGGTSLSKAFGLISRFSEDIDITIFRQDLGTSISIDELEGMSGKKRQARLDDIRSACQSYLRDRLLLDLTVKNITTIQPARTFWDKVVILHGLRAWHSKRGELRQQGQRISRHYYDLHVMFGQRVGEEALHDRALGHECARHARMFFSRPDYNLVAAASGDFAIRPVGEMLSRLRRDYDAMTGMVFGPVPPFNDIVESIASIEDRLRADGHSLRRATMEETIAPS